MILAVDIGNTNCTFGVFERRRLVGHFAIATRPHRTAHEVTLQLKALAKSRTLPLARVTQIVVCSVVPRMTSVLTESLHSLKAVPVRMIGKEILVPLTNRYTYPEQVGQDRLVGGYAAWCEFSGSTRFARSPSAARQRESKDCIVADFGTAITIDVVTRRGEYVGGVIVPGLEISLDALATRTALLPKIELREPPELLGRDTANSIRAGLVYGCAALCDGIVTQLKKQYAPGATVIATGGSASLIAHHSKRIQHLRPNLVLDGLARLALNPR
jgi:type III pantothenate kinase